MKTNKTNMMKGVRYSASIAMGLMLTATVFTACQDDDTNSEGTDATSENVIQLAALPVSDQCTVKFDKKAVVLGNEGSDFNATVLNRMTQQTKAISEDAQAFVFTNDYHMDFSDEEMKVMMKAYLNDACFVLIEPNMGDIEQLQTKAVTAIKSLIADGEDVSQAYSFFDKLASLKQLNIQDVYDGTSVLAFRKHDLYVVRDLDTMIEVSDKSSTFKADVDGEIIEDACIAADYEATDYDRGEATDMLVTWMNEDGEADMEPAGLATRVDDAQATIEKYMQGNRVVIQEQVGPSRAMGKTLRYELVYTIYSAYDFDKDADYYFIRLRPNFHCSAMGCPGGHRDWIVANKVVVFDDGSTSGRWSSSERDAWYGTYMSAFNFTGEIVDKYKEVSPSNAELIDASPKTDVSGSSTYSTGFSCSLSGNLGFNSTGLNGGISGGVSFSESNSHSHPSMMITHKEEGPVTKWNISGIVPRTYTVYDFPFFYMEHDLVATFQRTDWQTEFTWVVKVANPKSQSLPFYLKATDFTEITDLNISKYDLELRVHPTQVHYIELTQPNRAYENFIITCSDNNLQNVLKDQYSKTWNNEFAYYGHDNTEVENGAKVVFNGIKNAIAGYSTEIVEKGFTGKYTFRLKTVEGRELVSFTMDNGKIVD